MRTNFIPIEFVKLGREVADEDVGDFSLQTDSKVPLGGPEMTVLEWEDREFSIL